MIVNPIEQIAGQWPRLEPAWLVKARRKFVLLGLALWFATAPAPGRSYTLQNSPSLASAAWSNAASLVATQATEAIANAAGSNAMQFFRLAYWMLPELRGSASAADGLVV